MVWHGRVWDDAADDWAHELDDAPEPKRAPIRSADPTPEPRQPCIQRMEGNHDFGVVYSGRFRCRLCGFDAESTYEQVGNVFVGNGHVVLDHGTGLPDSVKP